MNAYQSYNQTITSLFNGNENQVYKIEDLSAELQIKLELYLKNNKDSKSFEFDNFNVEFDYDEIKPDVYEVTFEISFNSGVIGEEVTDGLYETNIYLSKENANAVSEFLANTADELAKRIGFETHFKPDEIFKEDLSIDSEEYEHDYDI